MKLIYKFILSAIFIIILLSAANSITTSFVLENLQEERLKTAEVLFAKSLSNRLFRDVVEEKTFELTGVLFDEKKLREEKTEYILIFNKKGYLLAHTYLGTMPKYLLKLKNDFGSKEEYQLEKIKNKEIFVYDIAVPVKEGIKQVGTIHFGIKGRYIQNIIKTASTSSLIVTFIVSLIAIFIALLISRVMIKPLIELNKVAVEIGKGNLDVKIEVKSNDEIGQLASSFNKMAEDLKKITVSKDYVDNIIGSMSDALFIIDPDAKIREVNKASCELLGYDKKELVGKPAQQLFEGEIPCEGKKLKELTEKGFLENYELLCLSRDKVKIPVLFSASIMKNLKGENAGIVGVGKDIRELKSLQARLALSEKLAAMGKVAGIMGHEFRNQLSVMRNSIYFLKMKLPDADEKIKRHLAILEGQAIETNSIIENILMFAATKHPEFKAADLKNILLTSINKVRISEKIKIINQIDEDLPEIQADSIQLAQVFVNIVKNAVEAMKEEGRLTIAASRIGDFINIQFEDTGPGIKAEDKMRLFEPFFSTKANGTGLGLVISNSMVRAHGGSINIESEEGKGTAVIIRLPVKAQDARMDLRLNKEEKALVNKRKILIVDDNVELCKNLSDILELKGYKVISAYDGHQAIKAVKKDNFNIVFMDVKMPGMNGIDTLKILRQIAPGLAVILITAFADDIFYKESLKSGDFEIIQKPIDIDKLLVILENIQGKKSQ